MSTTDSAVPRGAPAPGSVFAGKYRVERVLGVGGMGYVLAATHLHLRERVAIKLLLPELSNNTEVVERFMREGRAAVRIRSEHVARILDVAELPNGTPFIVMEYLEGSDLSQVVEARGPLPCHEAVDYLLQACEAIAEAHAMKTIHRDLKPSNLFLTQVGGAACVKVLDFGISKTTGLEGADLSMTKTSAMMGSPLYMSPEQLKSSRNVDERSDIWALGVILYELLVGKQPFVADTIAELGALVLSGQPPWLAQARPDVPAGMSEIVATCLRRHAAERFTNLADFADALAPFGTAGARESAAIIVRTLGMPAVRAQRAAQNDVSPPLSSPNLLAAGSQDAAMQGGTGAPWSGSGSGANLHPRPHTSAPAFAVAAGAVALLALTALGGVLLVPRFRATSGATVASPSTPAAAESVAAPSAAPARPPEPSPMAPPAVEADAGAAPAASTEPKAPSTKRPAAPRALASSKPTAPAAPTTTSSAARPSAGGFATGSKD